MFFPVGFIFASWSNVNTRPLFFITLFFAAEENFKAQIVNSGISVILSSFNTFPTITIVFSPLEYFTIRDNEIGDWCEREENNLFKIIRLNLDFVLLAKKR